MREGYKKLTSIATNIVPLDVRGRKGERRLPAGIPDEASGTILVGEDVAFQRRAHARERPCHRERQHNDAAQEEQRGPHFAHPLASGRRRSVALRVLLRTVIHTRDPSSRTARLPRATHEGVHRAQLIHPANDSRRGSIFDLVALARQPGRVYHCSFLSVFPPLRRGSDR